MKILKYFGYYTLFMAFIYFGIGVFVPSVHYGHKIIVDKPIKEAWAIAQDDSKYPQWISGFKSITHISGELGQMRSKYKTVVNLSFNQEDLEMIKTIVSIEEFDHVSLSFDSEIMTFEQIMRFSETNSKTTIQTESKVIGKSVITHPMFAIMELLGGAFTEQETINIEALKKVIEENNTNY